MRQSGAVRIDPPRPLNEDEERVLALLLHPSFSGVHELRDQARQAVVVGRCDCGCPTIELSVPSEMRAAVPAPNRLAPVEGRITSDTGEPVGDILLFVDDGRISSLELVWYTDDPPRIWPPTVRIRAESTDAA